jgi:hypothetical protein
MTYQEVSGQTVTPAPSKIKANIAVMEHKQFDADGDDLQGNEDEEAAAFLASVLNDIVNDDVNNASGYLSPDYPTTRAML